MYVRTHLVPDSLQQLDQHWNRGKDAARVGSRARNDSNDVLRRRRNGPWQRCANPRKHGYRRRALARNCRERVAGQHEVCGRCRDGARRHRGRSAAHPVPHPGPAPFCHANRTRPQTRAPAQRPRALRPRPAPWRQLPAQLRRTQPPQHESPRRTQPPQHESPPDAGHRAYGRLMQRTCRRTDTVPQKRKEGAVGVCCKHRLLVPLQTPVRG